MCVVHRRPGRCGLARRWLLAASAWLALCAPLRAATGDGVAARVVIDGRASEYTSGEWVVDETTPLPERRDDSQWGSDNDVARIAITWDESALYAAVECVTYDSQLLLLIDCVGGGVRDMRALGDYRRAIVFPSTFSPDLVVFATPLDGRPTVLWLDGGASERLDLDSRFAQAGTAGGALELAVPWDRIGSPASIRVAAAVTGRAGEGAGDCAPDPHAVLSTRRAEVAFLDRFIAIPVDGDGDGVPDAGVSPRAVMSAGDDAATERGEADLSIHLGARAFAPDDGGEATFRVVRDGPAAGAADVVYMSARVFARNGELVRVLFEDERRFLTAPVEDRWDGTDRFGRLVPGGIYLVNVSWGVARGARTGSTSAAVAVVR